MDEEIKKLLKELHMEELLKRCEAELEPSSEEKVLQEPTAQEEMVFEEVAHTQEAIPEPALQKKRSFFSKSVVVALVFLSLVFTAWTVSLKRSEPTPELQAEVVSEEENDAEDDLYVDAILETSSWAKTIDKKDSSLGHSMRVLWQLLRDRKEDLDAINDDLSTLLTSNAEVREDFCKKQANILLSRYSLLDGRYAFEISNQIALLKTMIDKVEDTTIEQAFREMVSDLGCQTYTRYQYDIVGELVDDEMDWRDAIGDIQKSTSLLDLHHGVSKTLKTMRQMKKNEFSASFFDIEAFRRQLTTEVEKRLDHFLFQKEGEITPTSENRALLQSILDESGISDEDEEYFLRQFDSLIR